MEKELTVRGIIPGITGYVSKPCTYTVNYLNGSQTYTEKFAVINIGSQYTGNASKEIDAVIESAAAALGAAAGSATGGLGMALQPLASIALHWLKDQVFNPDGSVTLMLAYHNIGTKNFGVDPTFWPGGLDPNFWNGVVDSISVAVSMLGSKYDNQEEVEFYGMYKTPGNMPQAERTPAIELLKEYYSEDGRLMNMYSRSAASVPVQALLQMGVPILVEEGQLNSFLKKNLDEMKSRGREIDSRSVGCFACKTIAYSVATGLVFMGGAVVAELSVGAPIVATLASALGVPNAVALGYIGAAVGAIVYGADAVVVELCNAAGCC